MYMPRRILAHTRSLSLQHTIMYIDGAVVQCRAKIG